MNLVRVIAFITILIVGSVAMMVAFMDSGVGVWVGVVWAIAGIVVGNKLVDDYQDHVRAKYSAKQKEKAARTRANTSKAP